jgi:hypothetical protein
MARTILRESSKRQPTRPQSHDEDSWGLLYGVGINYQVNPRTRVRLNWEQNDQLSVGLNLGGGIGFYEVGGSRLVSLGFDYRL